MKPPYSLSFVSRLSAAAATLFLTCGLLPAQAPPNPTITLNETGQGMIQLPNGFVIPLAGSLAPDPGPGGLPAALSFTFRPAEGGFVVGDVLMVGMAGVVGDVIRFNPAVLVSGVLTQQVFFYSADIGGGLLGDTGLPLAFYANAVSIVENTSGFTIYTPTAGQPGFNPGSTFPTTYRFASPMPDSSWSFGLLAMALCVFPLLRVRARSAAARGD